MTKELDNELKKLGLSVDNNNTLYIKKSLKPSIKINKIYIIKLSYKALNPDSNSILLKNYNHGFKPNTECMQIEVLNILNNIINVHGVEYNDSTGLNFSNIFDGWLDINELEVLKQC